MSKKRSGKQQRLQERMMSKNKTASKKTGANLDDPIVSVKGRRLANPT